MRCALSLLFLSNIAHNHTTLSSVASKFGRGKMAENPLHACNILGMGWDWVDNVLFHCFFEMCEIPESLLKILIFTLLVCLVFREH